TAEPQVRALAQEVRETILTFCEQNGFAFLARIKTVESLADKIEGGRYANWESLDDLFGCTIITPTLNEEAKVEAFCNSIFVLQFARRRGAPEKSFEVFRFDATRLYYKLKPTMGDD